ncbi:KR domain superfamily [Synechococcus sp. PCC 7335]|uniref:SDR family NAD(P)-dependent oxidoreductase n=1 Tax=Synechococcus sp. (strain ATCC 29403 / PCC 7335) TaxID=91464 RepID=UPI00017EB7E7|nr:SDR family oxidoreductase [Synechococcus sp. PCC 7335]EDX86210.1 KR domain superfamily [Synechococcus sp. PCC 7335]
MNKTVLITGASRGIGEAFAQVYAEKQDNLILVARNESDLNALKADLSSQYNINIVVLACDLTKEEEVQQVYDQVEQQNLTVDVLINNAGYGDYGEFVSADWPKLQGMILLNVLALTRLSHLFLPSMIARGQGQILNVSSTAAFQPGPRMAVYFATKAYVLSLSEALSAETEGTGVSVTVLCPGPTQSNFGQNANMEQMALGGNVTSDKLPSALDVAEYGYKALNRGEVVAVHGAINKVLTFMPRLTPRAVIRKGVKQFMAPK